MSYELRAEELAAQSVLALPERELLDTITTVAPIQLALAANLAYIDTDDVGGSLVVAQANEVWAYQNTEADIDND